MTLTHKKVLVTGATGFLGGHLVQRLSDEGADVYALARRPERDQVIRDLPNVSVVMGDITNPAQMQDMMQGMDYVFHVAAALGGNLQYQQMINVDGTANVAYGAVENHVKRLIHVSSIAYYGFPVSGSVTEEHAIVPTKSPYNITKARAEDTLRMIAKPNGLSYSILRPALIYGARSHPWTETMFKLAKRNPTPFIGDGRGHAHPIHVDDVVDLCMTLATHPDADGEAFNCAPTHPPTWREFLGTYAALAGHQNWLPLPVGLVKAIAPILDVVVGIATGEPRALPAMVDFITSDARYTMDKAKHVLDWQPSVSLEDGIASCVPFLREKGLLS
jgi:nucleoside-diphosphate-sugar epimerase